MKTMIRVVQFVKLLCLLSFVVVFNHDNLNNKYNVASYCYLLWCKYYYRTKLTMKV